VSSFVYNALWQILFVTYHFKAVFLFHLCRIPSGGCYQAG